MATTRLRETFVAARRSSELRKFDADRAVATAAVIHF
jgi:hypothetical protein